MVGIIISDDKFKKKLEYWKSSLLDLTRRNKQLYFNPEGKRRIEIIAPAPAELFDKILSQTRKLEFIKIFNRENNKEKYTSEQLNELHDKQIKKAINKKRSTHLITRIEDQTLNQLLKRMRRNARSSIEERGVNILFLAFGLMRWYDPLKPKDPVYSPILFVPVKLDRKNILSNYYIELLDDDVIVNYTLRKKLKDEYKIELPEFDDETEITPESMTSYFNQIREIISINDSNWSIEDRVFIDLFTFSKIRLYQDLELHQDVIMQHPLIRAIALGEGYNEAKEHIPGKIGDAIAPENTYSILDTDSSQQLAIEYAKKGASLIIRGPPGTGKSQTIANIIAECLADDKKVLFVAQKKAALDVVKERLDKYGVGEFCIDIHSQKSNKANILDQIRKSMGSSYEPVQYPGEIFSNLKQTRDKLNSYIDLVHQKLFNTDQTLYTAIAKYSQLDGVPLVKGRFHNIQFSYEDLYNIKNYFKQLQIYDGYFLGLVSTDNNPWVNSILRETDITADKLLSMIDNVYTSISQLTDSINKTINKHGILDLNQIKDINRLHIIFRSISPGILKYDVEGMLNRFINEYHGLFKIFKRNYRKDRKILKKHIKRKQILKKNTMTEILQKLVKIKNIHVFAKLEKIDDLYEEINNIEMIYARTASDKLKLTAYIELNINLSEKSFIKELEANLIYLDKLLNSSDELSEWIEYHKVIDDIKQNLGKTYLHNFKEVIQNSDGYILYEQIFEKSYLKVWIDKAIKQLNLQRFNNILQEELKEDFIDLDQRLIKLNRYRIIDNLFENRNKENNTVALSMKNSEVSLLQREMLKKRRIKPLRKLFSQTRNYLTTLKPCFLMSPLSVAEYLPGDRFNGFFDVVIFDEASQVSPEDAVGAILRGKQLIVVGDPKQMPPTNFFSVTTELEDEDEEFYTMESILDECIGIGLTDVYLKWHYRSKKENLITFSNYHYYDNLLNTFPDTLRFGSSFADTVDKLDAIDFVNVNGVYDKGKTRKNEIEAETVAQAIIHHFKWCKSQNKEYSLGVVAFSQAQADAITHALENLYRDTPTLENLVNSNKEHFFIKNLENVQGDERDFIFFSVGYAKDKHGKMSLNFGPLNKKGGERRLNVAITRARYHIKLFCSFNPEEVDTSRTNSLGVKHLIDYLIFAKTRSLTKEKSNKYIRDEFAVEVSKALNNMGYETETNVGNGSYKIDVGLVDPSDNSKYLISIETDGSNYMLGETCRDRNRIRPEMLRLLGWKPYHIWTPTWYKNKDEILNDIIQLIDAPSVIRKIPKDEGDVNISHKTWMPSKNVKKAIYSDIKYRRQLLDNPLFEEYHEFVPLYFLETDEIYESDKYKKIIGQIVEQEGPIHRDLLIKRLMNVFQVKRRTHKIDSYLKYTLRSEFYQSKDWTPKIRIAIDQKTDPRSFEHISESELILTIKYIIQNAKTSTHEDLMRAVINIFGYKVLKADMKERLNWLIDNLISSDNNIILEDGMIRYLS